MRTGFILWIIFLGNSALATNFYVSNAGNDAWRGTHPQAPWQTLSRLQSALPQLKAGDSIFLKRGDRFFGQLNFEQISGVGKWIYMGAYGNGERPVISGFATTINWQPSLITTLWEANLTMPSSNYPVVVNHQQLVDRGRYPDTGFMAYQLVKGKANTLQVNGINPTQNWEGADFMVRKEHWIFDASKVIKQQGNQFQLQPPITENYYAGKDGFGLFVQNHSATLNLKDEWKYDFVSQKISIKTLGAAPDRLIKIGVLDYLINIRQSHYLIIENLQFEGANAYGILIDQSGNIRLNKCHFKWLGLAAIQANYSDNIQIENNQFEQLPNNGIKLACLSKNNFTISDNHFKQIALIAGLQASGDGNGKAIYVAGNHIQISKNVLDSLGYIGIEFQGNHILVNQNIVQNFCMVKDDGGAIYTWLHWGHQQFTDRTIQDNLILFGHGAAAGTTSKNSQDVRGIYLDGGTTHVKVQRNTIAYCNGAGIYLNSAQHCSIQKNILFANQVGIGMNSRPELPPIRDIQIHLNKIVALHTNQVPIFYWNGNLKKTGLTSIETDLQHIGQFNNNRYYSATAWVVDFFYHQTENGQFINPEPYSLRNWQQHTKQDLNSRYSLLNGHQQEIQLYYKTDAALLQCLPPLTAKKSREMAGLPLKNLPTGQSTIIYKHKMLD